MLGCKISIFVNWEWCILCGIESGECIRVGIKNDGILVIIWKCFKFSK